MDSQKLSSGTSSAGWILIFFPPRAAALPPRDPDPTFLAADLTFLSSSDFTTGQLELDVLK